MTIRELRESRKLSQAVFARLIGVSRTTVNNLEQGRAKVSTAIADKIWEVFGVEIWADEEPKPAKKPAKLEIYIQSPLGGNITPEEVAAKMPAGAESAYVRVDQNLIWWVRGDETGAVEIWRDER